MQDGCIRRNWQRLHSPDFHRKHMRKRGTARKRKLPAAAEQESRNAKQSNKESEVLDERNEREHGNPAFEDKKIRTAWDAEQEKWYFSIVDVIAVLTEQQTARNASTYWAVLKSV